MKRRLKCYSAAAFHALSNVKQTIMMKKRNPLLQKLLSASCLIYAAIAVHASAQTLSDLGTCALESGQRIEACKVGYLTAGTLNAEKSNAILLPSWFGGKSNDLLRYVGPDKLFDSSRYFVVIVDSFGNGVSSSPSNTAAQPMEKFPAVTLRDMIAAHRRLLKEKFGIEKLHAAVGISMGAMQAITLAADDPDAAKHFVAIAGSPKLAPFDVILWESFTRHMDTFIECNCQTPLAAWAAQRFLMRGVDHHVRATPPEKLDEARDRIAKSTMTRGQAFDRKLQVNAMLGLNAAAKAGGDMTVAAKRAGSKLLVVTGAKDYIVTPQPVREFAKAGGAKLIDFAACDHDLPACETELQYPVVREFLGR